DEKLARAIFASEWDSNSENYRKPPDGQYTPYIRTVKKLLTGQDAKDYAPPNAARLSNWLSEAFSSSEDRDTGFLTLSAETPEPDLMIQVMSQVTEETDRLLKERYIASAEQTMGFYQQQLAKARAREHREALAKLIAQEDQKLMLASKGTYFVAEPLTEPSVSLNPTSPKASLVLALSVVLGGFFGAALVLIRKALRS
ncbi:MAG: GNVR domain-containing protein, partial [Paracoccaceae bacterium]